LPNGRDAHAYKRITFLGDARLVLCAAIYAFSKAADSWGGKATRKLSLEHGVDRPFSSVGLDHPDFKHVTRADVRDDMLLW
jgi:hypothetical protein